MLNDLRTPCARTAKMSVLLALALLNACVATVPNLHDNFEADKVAAFWSPGSAGSGRYEPGAVLITDARARSGKTSAQITVREGDIEQHGGDGQRTERAELDSGKHPLLGKRVKYAFSFLIPRDFPIVDNRLVIAQWKQDQADRPLIALRFRDGNFYVTINQAESLESQNLESHDLPLVELGAWNDLVINVFFSALGNGRVQVSLNGNQVIDYRGPTAVDGGPNLFYNKLGLYRDRWPDPMTIFIDDYSMSEAPELSNSPQSSR